MKPQFTLPPHLKKLPQYALKALSLTAFIIMGKSAVAGIHKSPNDHREQLSFKLSNDLSVLIISDPNTDKAAAAMNIAVGSNADPETRPGLAHFLEHMIFLGTDKYPEAGAYKSFIQSHGGQMNAYTAYENTNYYFDVSSDSLEPALDRFAQLFIAPLLNKKYVERERHAVHSEYQAKIRDDQRRSSSVVKQIMNPSHSYSHFSVGSLQTLKGNVRNDLLDFYNQYYSSNMMTLVIEGRESLPELKAMAEKLFSQVPNRHTQPIATEAPLFDKETLPARLSIKTLKDDNSLTLTFPVTSIRDHWHEKPLQYIADLVGYEGHGSLLAYLKQQGLADALYSATTLDLKEQAIFKVKIDLTDRGKEQQNHIIESFFAYIDLIKQQGVQQALYQEQSKLRSAEFRFAQKLTPMKEVSRLAALMQRYPTDHVFDAPYVMDSFKPQQISDYLGQLSPDNMLVTEQSADVETDQTDPWYKTGYRIEKLTRSELKPWKNPKTIAGLNVRSNNAYIAQNFDIKPHSEAETGSSPELIFQRDGLRLWHLQDSEFSTPKADTFFSVSSPLANDCAESAIMTALYTQLIKDQLNERLYDAQLAGINTRIYNHMRGFSVRISGYSDKQPLLLKEITSALKSADFDRQRFDLIKARFKDSLSNNAKDKPYNQTTREIFRLLLPEWSTEDKIAALDTIQLRDLEAFVAKLFTENSIRMMTHGNLTVEDSMALAKTVEDNFIPDQQKTPVAHAQVVRLQENQPLIQTLEIDHSDSAISVYFQGQNTSVQTHAEFRLLNEIASSSFYHQLRTEKQLGYIVFGTPLTLGNAPGLAFVVQSPVAEPQALERHIKTFVSNLGGTLDSINQNKLEQIKKNLIAKVMKQDKNLSARSNRFWKDIDDEALEFDSHQALANAVADISMQDLIDCYEKMAARQLVVRSFGQKHKPASTHSSIIEKRCDTEVLQLKREGEYFEV